MRLSTFSYSEFPDNEYKWTLEPFDLSKVNLLVGRNASGKTRTINVIANLGNVLSGTRTLQNGVFNASFCNGDALHYMLEYENSQVVREDLTKAGTSLLHRARGSYGKIHSEDLHQDIRFNIPGQQLAVFTKRDSLQHPFLEPLLDWGGAVRHFEFGKTMGHEALGVVVKEASVQVNEKDTTKVGQLYHRGIKTYGDEFKTCVIKDMGSLGYPIQDIDLRRPFSVQIQGPVPLELVGISVKEADLPCYTDQISMSQGMFRALSIIVHINYLVLSRTATCILVDDIGEGLDYHRSCKLIELLRERSYTSALQLIMATNDRFVMNNVPLDEWCYLIRRGNHVRVLNYNNARDAFERFKVTGLNNFDLLATDFLEQVTTNGKTCSVR